VAVSRHPIEEIMKVSKMIKQAMAYSKLQNPSNFRHIHRAWIGAVENFAYVKKNQGKMKQEAATE
jgi:hypothetical protein